MEFMANLLPKSFQSNNSRLIHPLFGTSPAVSLGLRVIRSNMTNGGIELPLAQVHAKTVTVTSYSVHTLATSLGNNLDSFGIEGHARFITT